MPGKRQVNWSQSKGEMKKNLTHFRVNRNNYPAIHRNGNESARALE
jgi:hypothetical protein